MTRTQALRALLFLLLLTAAIALLLKVFTRDKKNITYRGFQEFYSEPENAVDGIIVGASLAHRGWISAYVWHETGMAIFPMATNGQPIVLTTNILEEVKKTQNIKFALIDVSAVRTDVVYDRTEGSIRNVTDSLKFTKNRWESVDKIMSAMDIVKAAGYESVDTSDFSFYFPFLKYHSRWQDGLTKDDFIGGLPTMKVFHTNNSFDQRPKNKLPNFVTKTGTLSEVGTQAMEEILAYGKENDIELIFTAMPTLLSEKAQTEINTALAMAEEAGYDCINMNTKEMFDTMQIEPTKDYMDSKHLNVYGAKKVTAFLMKYLKDKYAIRDKRGDEAYKSWDEAYVQFQKFFEEGNAKVQAAE